MNKLAILILIIVLSSCSKDKAEINSNTEVDVQEPIILLDLVSVEKTSDTPNDDMGASIINNDKLFIIDNQKTYEYDFVQATWNLISEDENLPENWIFYSSINIMRNGKWNIFCDRGLFEFDFELKDWKVVQSFPIVNGIFSTHGFYKDDVIYFVDNSSGNDNIYKYDFESKEVTIHGNYENMGNRNTLSKQVFKIGNTFYYLTQTSIGFTFYKFSTDFKNLELLFPIDGSIVPEMQSLPNGVAFIEGENIIFGISGTATSDTDGNLYNSVVNKELYFYNTNTNDLGVMPSSFYDECHNGSVVSHNNEHYLLYGYRVKEKKKEYRKTMERMYFDYVEQ